MTRASMPKGLSYYRKGGGASKKSKGSKICPELGPNVLLIPIRLLMPILPPANIAKIRTMRKKPKAGNGKAADG